MISSLVLKWSEKTPDESLLVTSDRQFTYSEVAHASLRFASRLRELGVSKGDHVGIAAQNGAKLLRVHDVAATVDALKVWNAVAAQTVPAVRSSRPAHPQGPAAD